jgi:hypothetical protein
MMKTKLIAICALATLLLITGSTVKANQIVDLVDSTENQVPFPPDPGVQPGPNFFPGGQTEGYLISAPDWGWTHAFDFGGTIDASSIISATLEIEQFGVLATDQHQIFLDGISVGFLDNRSPAWPDGFPYELRHITVFNLNATAIDKLTDEEANMWFDIDWPNSAAIYWSRLTINYIPAGLDRIEISGPTEVGEDLDTQYTCTAYFINGSIQTSSDITNSATWSENSNFAVFNSPGVLTTSSVSQDETCRIKATFGNETDTLDITIKNVIPIVSISAPTSLAAEPGFNGIFEVSRTGSTKDTLQVFYDTSGSTAEAGTDYMALPGYVDILAGETVSAFSVNVIDDNIEEATETVELTLIPDSSYIIDSASATVTIDDDEEGTIPETSGHIPAKDSIQVARDTLIQLHITDAGSGVEFDGGPVTIHVEGDLIYDGANETSPGVYDSSFLHPQNKVKGKCRRTGTETDYTFTFQASDLFDYEQKVDVEVHAKDKSGYEITDTYSFYTLMQTFGRNIRVNTDVGTFAQDHPDSAIDSDGNIWVVWEHAVIAGDSDIYIGKLPKDGSAFEASQLVFGDQNDQRKPAIAINGIDTIYVVWQSKDSNGFWDIYVSALPFGSSNWASPLMVNSSDPPYNESNQTSPAIAIDGDNQLYIAWEDDSEGDSDKNIWAISSVDDDWNPVPIETAASNQTEPFVSIDLSNNTAYIFWTDARNATTDIYAAKFTTSWSTSPLVETNSNQWSPVGATANGDIHLLWVDDYLGYDDIFYGKDGSNLPIDDGTSIIDEPETFQSFPSMSIATHDTKVFACWQDSRNVSGNADTDIYYTENSGSGFGTNILVNDDIGTFTQTSPVIGTDIVGNPFMVWVDNREGNNDIYGTITTSTGSILRKTTVNALFPTVQIVQINEDSDNIDDAEDVTIEIPAGALPVSTEIRISQLNNPPDPPAGAFGIFYEFSPSGLEFLLPVTISIPHAAADCPGHAVYNVYYYDPTILPPASPWRRDGISNVQHMTSSQDPTLPPDVHAVRYNSTHFTAFGIGGSATAPAAGGGGGGGGGCSMSAGNEGNIVEFLLPYIGFIIVLVILTVRDARVRKASR